MTIREYSIDYNRPDEAAKTMLQMHIDTLKSFRGRANNEVEMEWEIRLYEFMMESPAERLADYNRVRYEDSEKLNAPPREKREVVAILGWVVP